VDHRAIAQNWKVEAIAVEGHELRRQLATFSQNALISCFSHVRRPQRVHHPAVVLAVSHQLADAHDGV
jgi:hypothetical protein